MSPVVMHKYTVIAAWLCSYSAFALRINCGGKALDSGFEADSEKYYGQTKSPVKTSFQKAPWQKKATHFTTHAWTRINSDLIYRIPVEKGKTYNTTLYFSETWKWNFGKGLRVFDVVVNGKQIESNVDVWSKVGAYKPYIVKVPSITATSNGITVKIVPRKRNPMISAISVKMIPTPKPNVEKSVPTPKPQPKPQPKVTKNHSLMVNFTRAHYDYPKKVFEAAGTIMGNEGGKKYLVVFGGYYQFPGVTKAVYQREFKAANAEWERLADMPAKVTHVAQWTDGKNTFCGVGGYDGDYPGTSGHSCFCYNRATNKYIPLPDLPGDRAGGGLAMIKKNGKRMLLYAGGVDRTVPTFEVHIDYGTTWTLDYEDKNATWQKVKEDMPDPRNHMAAVESCGRYYFVGGQREVDEEEGNVATVSEFLPESMTWSKNPPAPLPFGLGHVSASVMAYKCGIMVVGGLRNGKKMVTAVQYYNSTTNAWSTIGWYPHEVATPVCGIHGDEILCATGGDYLKQNDVFFGKISST